MGSNYFNVDPHGEVYEQGLEENHFPTCLILAEDIIASISDSNHIQILPWVKTYLALHLFHYTGIIKYHRLYSQQGLKFLLRMLRRCTYCTDRFGSFRSLHRSYGVITDIRFHPYL